MQLTAGDIYKTVEKWEKAFWYVIFANHERALGSSAMRIHHKNSSAALMRQLAYTTFKSLVSSVERARTHVSFRRVRLVFTFARC